MLLALPCGHDHVDIVVQGRTLEIGFISYLQQKQAAGIVNVALPGSPQVSSSQCCLLYNIQVYLCTRGIQFHPNASLFKRLLLSSESTSPSGRHCRNVFVKSVTVLRHSACCCRRTKCICDDFLPSLSWLSSASFPCYHSLHYCLL